MILTMSNQHDDDNDEVEVIITIKRCGAQSALRNSTNKKKKTTTRCEVGDDVCGRSLLCYAIQRILVFIIDVMI